LQSAITATFGDPSTSHSSTVTIPVSVIAVQAESAFAGAQAAGTLGRSDIAITLSNLATAMCERRLRRRLPRP
jgi:hypothetical protein